MEEATKDINRIKVVLVEKKRTNKWLAEQLGKDPATVSKWCTNTSQPGLETLLQIANVLDVDVKDLLHSTKEDTMYFKVPTNFTMQEMQRCISNQTYTALLSSKDNMSKGLLNTYPNAPIMFKDTLFVDFLNLPKKHSESKLRKGLVEHMKQFILELGKDFIFMDQEYRLNIGASTFKADLLFFHRGLQALVAVELKKTKFHPRDLGQLEFYLEALDRDVKRSNENPSIGIILCPEADKVVVEYAMSRSMSPTMIAEYKRILIPQERMQQQLNEFCNLFLDKD